ncbi:MAG TPA: DNA polymerase III subunit beta [Flavipsychrobacter sp.]|jgi:DNA polymerase III subunit beta|nr:DNA polymerase III subunit beta [Chitinophagales bacterium]HLO70027.1 DNA polymerase III subunit beta [Flavipsychrobacter sp.]
MRFIVTSTALLKNLQQIGGVISANTVLSVLEDFLFELKGNTLTLTATDLETMMRVQMDVNDAQGDGRICIPSKILTDYLKNLPEQPITFNVNLQDLSIEMSSDVGKYKIGGEKADDFPKEPAPGETTSFNMSSIALIESINNTLFAVSNDTLRPAMTGVYFELSKTGITFVSTDAHRLVQYGKTDIACPVQDGFVVPKKPLQQLKATLSADDTQLQISYNSSHLFVTSNKMSMSCRLIDAKFPDYKAVIPKDNPYRLTISRADFVSALRRVSIFANKTTNQVVLEIKGNSLELSAQDIDFSYEGKETLNCQYSGEDMKIAFNAKLMVEMLNNMTGADVQLELSTPTRAGIFRPTEKADTEEVLMLLMPLMVGV